MNSDEQVLFTEQPIDIDDEGEEQVKGEEPLDLMIVEGENGKVMYKVVLPWYTKSGNKEKNVTVIVPKEEVSMASKYYNMGIRSLSAAMVISYYMSQNPELRVASFGTQVYEMWLPVLCSYAAGNYVGPVGIILHGLKYFSIDKMF